MFWESDGMLLINGKIMTMENVIIESGFVQIENGKITAVGSMEQAPQEEEIIDLELSI